MLYSAAQFSQLTSNVCVHAVRQMLLATISGTIPLIVTACVCLRHCTYQPLAQTTPALISASRMHTTQISL